jgi:aminocarboxymuconate-semialdehyde decarboxylase
VNLFSCFTHAVVPHGRAGEPLVSRGKKGLFTVDMHCHVLSRRVEQLVAPYYTADKEPTLAFATDQTREINRTQRDRILPKQTIGAERLADMDMAGIDVQVLSPAPTQYCYWADSELGREASRLINDDIATMAAEDPRRFVALGNVPLQETRLAIEELRRCVQELGMRGIEINSNVNGEELASERLEPFFAAAEALDVVLFLHPLGFSEGRRLSRHYLNNVIGNPLESTIAVSHLIFEGVLDRYPGLKICVAHGGGYLPMYTGRMDHAYDARADCRVRIMKPPSFYLKQLYFDTVVFDPAHLFYLVSRYGSDHLLMGTDYPYDMAEGDPIGLVMRTEGLTDEDRARICGLNAARLLGIATLPENGATSEMRPKRF